MTRNHSNDPQQTAADFMGELEKDPDYRARVEQRERERRQSVAFNRKVATPVVEALHQAGFDVDWVGYRERS